LALLLGRNCSFILSGVEWRDLLLQVGALLGE